jgi:hypothetical protein
MKTKHIINGLLISSLMAAPLAQAVHTPKHVEKGQSLSNEQAVANQAVKALEKEQNALLKAVRKGVLEGYKNVVKATELLREEGKEQAAIELLQAATGKFDVALTADPKLDLVPIDAGVSVFSLITTPARVKAETKAAIDLLEEHKLQEARAILDPMRDEMVVSHVYLPMVTYPTAIKLATKYLVENKKEDALATLETTLSTIVVEKSILSLAIVRAEELLIKASKLDKSKKSDAHALLDAAQQELEVAMLLGYADKESKAYEEIKAQIKAIRKEIDGKNAVEKMYEKVKQSIKELTGK